MGAPGMDAKVFPRQNHLLTHLGTDLKLLDTAIEILQSLHLPTVVKTGRSMYEGWKE